MSNRKYAVGFVGILFLCGILFFMVKCSADNWTDDWAETYRKNLEYNFDDTAVNRKMKRKEWDKFASGTYVGSYDFNQDGQEEQVQIAFPDGETVQILLDGEEVLRFGIQNGDVQRVLTIVGIRYEAETYLAAVRSLYEENGGMGTLKFVVYRYQDGGFIKVWDIVYSGTIGARSIMVEGVLESSCGDKVFSYDVKEQQNDYIYQRSVLFADMKDLGIKLPFETVGKFETAYKRNVSGILNIILE